jgi:ribonuclease VapC
VILDSSAMVAVLTSEPEASSLLGKLQATPRLGVGAPTLLETSLVLTSRLGAQIAHGLLDAFLADLDVTILPFGEPHWREASEAFRRFGKGRHPAALNFGDCMAYATARLAREPLLCVGQDFPKTDLDLA